MIVIDIAIIGHEILDVLMSKVGIEMFSNHTKLCLPIRIDEVLLNELIKLVAKPVEKYRFVSIGNS